MSTPTSTPGTAARKPASTSRSPSRQESSAGTPPAANGVARNRTLKSSTGSPLSARGTVKKPGAGTTKDGYQDDESRAENAAMVEDLKSQLLKAETASEEYQKELAVLQAKLDEALGEQAKLEESANSYSEKVQAIQTENAEALKANKELQAKVEKEQAASNKEREQAAAREEEMNNTIQRMKDAMSQREWRKSVDGEGLARQTSLRGRRSPNLEANLGESPGQTQRDSSESNSKLLLQKDKVIETLRLELAEAQIKVVEVENAGGGRFQELEKALLETRMANAKLMEDNESYQFLLQEKTLNGELSSKGVFQTDSATSERSPSDAQGQGSSLARELETVEEGDRESELHVRKIEAELAAQKEQNKALTLYVNRIITKLLQTDKFEALFEEGSVTGDDNPLNANAKKDKELPPPPPAEAQKENLAPSLLQRATSVFGRGKGRPSSYVPPPSTTVTVPGVSPAHSRHSSVEAAKGPTPNEDPTTAPSIPLSQQKSTLTSRPHRRSKSEWAPASAILNKDLPNASSDDSATPSRVVSNSSQRLSPPSTGPNSPPNRYLVARSSFSGSGVVPPPLISEESSASAAITLEDNTNLPPPPSSSGASDVDSIAASSVSDARSQSTNTSMATSAMGAASSFFGSGLGRSASTAGNKMRPLRLVQEKEADDAERKRVNRQSWVGWFQRGPPAGAPGVAPSTPSEDLAPPRNSSSDWRPSSRED